jgi:hypothetical protein
VANPFLRLKNDYEVHVSVDQGLDVFQASLGIAIAIIEEQKVRIDVLRRGSQAGGDSHAECVPCERRTVAEAHGTAACRRAVSFVLEPLDITASLECAQQPKDSYALNARSDCDFLYVKRSGPFLQSFKDVQAFFEGAGPILLDSF